MLAETWWLPFAAAALAGAVLALLLASSWRWTMRRRRLPGPRPRGGLTVIEGGRVTAKPLRRRFSRRTLGQRARCAWRGLRRCVQLARLGIARVGAGLTMALYWSWIGLRWMMIASIAAVIIGAAVWLAGWHWTMDGEDLLSRIFGRAFAIGLILICTSWIYGFVFRLLFGVARLALLAVPPHPDAGEEARPGAWRG